MMVTQTRHSLMKVVVYGADGSPRKTVVLADYWLNDECEPWERLKLALEMGGDYFATQPAYYASTGRMRPYHELFRSFLVRGVCAQAARVRCEPANLGPGGGCERPSLLGNRDR